MIWRILMALWTAITLGDMRAAFDAQRDDEDEDSDT